MGELQVMLDYLVPPMTWPNADEYADAKVCRQGYFSNWTIPIFTSMNMDNRRGLGWDKPITGTEDGPTSTSSSASTFGHVDILGPPSGPTLLKS